MRFEQRKLSPVRPSQSCCDSSPVASAHLDMEMAGAAPKHLCILLYDRAIRLCQQAIVALDGGDAALAADRLGRAKASVQQLRDSLQDGQPEELSRFAELYNHVHSRLVEADFYRRREVVSETVSLLSRQRSTWQRLVGTTPAAPQDQHSWVG